MGRNGKKQVAAGTAHRMQNRQMRLYRMCTATVPLAIILLAVRARADSVMLTDGKIFHGTVVKTSAGEVTLQIDSRSKRRFNVDQIASIHFDHAERSASPSPIEQKRHILMSSDHPLGAPPEKNKKPPISGGAIVTIRTVSSTTPRRLGHTRCRVQSQNDGSV